MAVRGYMHRLRPNLLESGGGCLYWMWYGLRVMQESGLRAVAQCGTAAWNMVPPHLDDGISPTTMMFQWEGEDNAERRQMPDAPDQYPLPEMHCWIGLPDTNEIVDFSTGGIGKMAAGFGFEWTAEPLPSYLWSKCEDLPYGCIYRPDKDATVCAINHLAGIVRHVGRHPVRINHHQAQTP